MQQILPQTGHCQPLWLTWMSWCGAAGWTCLSLWLLRPASKRVFHIFYSWCDDFVELVLVLIRPYELIICKWQIEHGCSQRILCPHKSVCATDFYPVPFFPRWSTDVLSCLRQIFTKSLNLFFAFDGFLFPSMQNTQIVFHHCSQENCMLESTNFTWQ